MLPSRQVAGRINLARPLGPVNRCDALRTIRTRPLICARTVTVPPIPSLEDAGLADAPGKSVQELEADVAVAARRFNILDQCLKIMEDPNKTLRTEDQIDDGTRERINKHGVKWLQEYDKLNDKLYLLRQQIFRKQPWRSFGNLKTTTDGMNNAFYARQAATLVVTKLLSKEAGGSNDAAPRTDQRSANGHISTADNISRIKSELGAADAEQARLNRCVKDVDDLGKAFPYSVALNGLEKEQFVLLYKEKIEIMQKQRSLRKDLAAEERRAKQAAALDKGNIPSSKPSGSESVHPVYFIPLFLSTVLGGCLLARLVMPY